MITNTEILVYRRIFPIEGEITAKMLDEHRKNIILMALLGPKEPIYFPIHTPGGDLGPVLYFRDFLKGLGMPTTGIVCGKCCSSGLGILAACDTKLSFPNSDFIFHTIITGKPIKSVEDTEKQASSLTSICDDAKKKYIELLANGFGMTEEKVAKLMEDGEHHNTEIFAPEAKSLGIVSDIIHKFPWVT